MDIITTNSLVGLNLNCFYRNTGYITVVLSAKQIAESLNVKTSFKLNKHRLFKIHYYLFSQGVN